MKWLASILGPGIELRFSQMITLTFK
jgi:hypothetical protein